MPSAPGRCARSRIVACAFLIAAALSACSVVVSGITDECKSNGDCASKGAAYAGAVCTNGLCRPVAGAGHGGGATGSSSWECLGKVSWPSATTDSVVATFHVTDFSSDNALAGITIVACGALDLTCSSPLSKVALTDEKGDAKVTVSTAIFGDPSTSRTGFGGYFLFTRTDIVTMLYYWNPPIAAATPLAARAVSKQSLTTLLASIGATERAKRGHVFFSGADCNDKPAAGLRFTVDAGDDASTSFYFSGTSLSAMASQSDATGLGGVVNVPVGLTQARATINESSAPTSKSGILIRENALTFVRLPPSP